MRTCEERIKDCDDCETYHYYGQTHDSERCDRCKWNWCLDDNFVPRKDKEST